MFLLATRLASANSAAVGRKDDRRQWMHAALFNQPNLLMPSQQPSESISSLVFRNDADEKISVALPIVLRMRRVKCAYIFCLSLFCSLPFVLSLKSGQFWQADDFLPFLILLMAFICEVFFLACGLLSLWGLIKPMTLELNADGFLHYRLGKGLVLTHWNQVSRFYVDEIQTKVRHFFISYSVVKKVARRDNRNGPWWAEEWRTARLADNFGIPH
ncbi:hypothetical protein [Paraherbaspirillum soli]|uniref:DUF304 domain-containing protein n=1 Tax=Paraherbaspirillum soli TaxID=631222 RepID=A0ABW0M2W4_9BURK